MGPMLLLMCMCVLWVQELNAEMDGVMRRFDLHSDHLINKERFILCCKDVLGETRGVAIKFMKNQVRSWFL